MSKGKPELWILVKKLFRDEKMTVLMVKKYLLTKLGLSNQAEVTKRKTFPLFLSNKLKKKEKIITRKKNIHIYLIVQL